MLLIRIMPSASADSWFVVFSNTKNSDKKWSINGWKMSWQQLLRPLPCLLSSVHVINLKPWTGWIHGKDVDEWRAVDFRFHSSETPFLSEPLLTTGIALEDKADVEKRPRLTSRGLPVDQDPLVALTIWRASCLRDHYWQKELNCPGPPAITGHPPPSMFIYFHFWIKHPIHIHHST